ncbi:MAG: DUF5777 family beta-barrel protein [Cyclobacteriaceae bacterium]|nr:DUF5777 family beta-barrel protein [Cyclobacteriaceae bacterium]
MEKAKIILVVIMVSLGLYGSAQDDLDKLLDEMEDAKEKTEYITAAFKATRVINLQSLEKKAPGALDFRIAHRFGALNGGGYQLFGLDQATMRLSLEYGFNRFVTAGLGRSTYEKTYDFFAKTSIIQQQKGSRNIPISILYYVDMAVNGLKWQDPFRVNYFTSRLSYVHQLIIGSKVSDAFSFQLSPTIIHKNLLPSRQDQTGMGFLGKNNAYAVATAARLKLTNRTALTAEYILRIPPPDKTATTYAPFYNSLSAGVDIETGGHVFQFQLTNSLAMFDRGFITETAQSWLDGGIHFGFNITRDFTLKQSYN